MFTAHLDIVGVKSLKDLEELFIAPAARRIAVFRVSSAASELL
jgi:hypothetical protein